MSTKQTTGPSKAERLTSIIYALAEAPRRLTSSMIGEYLSPGGSDAAREKALERIQEDLRNEFGLQLISQKIDDQTHYSIDTSDWFLPEIEFTAAESGLIALAASLWKDRKLQALGLKAAARITGGSAEPEVSAYSGSLLPRLSLDEPNFHDCALAVFNRKALAFTYRGASGESTEREVDMWGLGQRFGNWYFTGWDHTRQAQRVFRLSRVQGAFKGVKRTEGQFHPRPEDFDMTQVLIDFDQNHPAYVATVQLLDDAAIALRARALNGSKSANPLRIAYADTESFAAELAAYGPAVKVMEPTELVQAVTEKLRAARTAQETLAEQIDPSQVKFRNQRATGRASTINQVVRNIDMIQYVVAHGNVPIVELARRYDLSVAKIREELSMIMMCGVPGGMHDELINVNDGDLDADTVTISNAALLGAPQKLAPMEAVAVLGGLNALESVPEFEHREVLASALDKLNRAIARFDGWEGALGFALSKVRESDVPAQLLAAIRNREVLNIDYYSAHSQSHQQRLVEPLRLVEDGPRSYLRAWCRSRERLLTFRVDRMLQVQGTGEAFELSARHEDEEKLDVRYHGSAEDLEAVFYVHADAVNAVQSFEPTEWSAVKVNDGYLAKVYLSYELVPAPLVAQSGGKIAVIASQEIRGTIRAWLEAALANYED